VARPCVSACSPGGLRGKSCRLQDALGEVTDITVLSGHRAQVRGRARPLAREREGLPAISGQAPGRTSESRSSDDGDSSEKQGDRVVSPHGQCATKQSQNQHRRFFETTCPDMQLCSVSGDVVRMRFRFRPFRPASRPAAHLARRDSGLPAQPGDGYVAPCPLPDGSNRAELHRGGPRPGPCSDHPVAIVAIQHAVDLREPRPVDVPADDAIESPGAALRPRRVRIAARYSRASPTRDLCHAAVTSAADSKHAAARFTVVPHHSSGE